MPRKLKSKGSNASSRKVDGPHRNTGQMPFEQLESRLFLSVTFNTAVTTQTASGEFPVTSAAVGDFNGDGIPDLIVGRDDLEAQLYTGTKAGLLALGPIVATGGNTIALGDFTGDTKLDLATSLGIYPGTASGAFGPLISGFISPPNVFQMYAEDVNGDGKLDLVCATFNAGSGTGTTAQPTIGISVLLGNGDGTFKPVISTTIGSGATLSEADAVLAFGDFNGDGKLDVVTPFGLMLGNGDGTFTAPKGLPYKGVAPGTTALPSFPVFAVGDFNGDSNLDLVTLPTAANNGSVELFTGDGRGGLTDSGPIVVAAGQTISALAAAQLTSSGNTDLIAGITATVTNSTTGNSTASDVAVLLNNGAASFAPAELFTVPGPSASITAVDFNGDGNLDLVTTDEVAGGVATNGVPLTVSASVLLNAQVAAVAPILTLHSSENPAVVGDAVTYTAIVGPPTTAAANSATPTGTVSFFNGTNLLGNAQLVKGKASITVTAAGLGVQAITFSYSGDVNYASATSAALSQTVLQTLDKVSLVVPALGAITLPQQFIPGDRGSATITLTNGGAATANGRVNINFYLSTSGAVDSSAIQLADPSLQKHPVHIVSGQSVTIVASLTLGNAAAANYFLVVQLTAAAGFTPDEVNSTSLFSPTTFAPAGPVFGMLGTHRNLKLRAIDAFGNVGVLTLSGPGTGTVTAANGQTNITITGTTTTSRFHVSSPGAFIVNNVDVQAVINGFAAPRMAIAGNLSLRGGVNNLHVASDSSADGSATTITVGPGAFLPRLSLGSVGNVTLNSTAKLATISAIDWQAGAINAPALATLNVAGAFGANVNIHAGGQLKLADIGGITGGTWAVSGGMQTLRIEGGAANVGIFVGADSGADNILGDGDDVYAPAAIFSLFIRGDVSSSTIAAGVTPASGQTIQTGIALLGNGAIRAMTLRGAVSDDSRFIAPHLPKTVLLNEAKVATATDPHFQPG